MATTVGGTSITFNDTTVQSTAFLGQSYQAFGSSGTFTVPTGITRIMVQVWAGGGGGGSPGSSGQIGGLGGYGGFGAAIITGLTPGGTVSVTVGSGGAGGNQTAGSAGGTSSFGSYISCTGGTAGAQTGGATALPGTATFSGVAQVLNKINYVGSASSYLQQSVAVMAGNGGGANGNVGYSDSCGSIYPGGGGGGGYGGGGGGGTPLVTPAAPFGFGGPAFGGGVSGTTASGLRTSGAGGGNGIASNGGAGVTPSTYGGGGGGGGGFVLVTW